MVSLAQIKTYYSSQRGQSLVELMLAIGLSAILLPAILTGLVASRDGKAQQKQRLEAVALLKEAEEAVRSVRDRGWNTFAINGTYHPIISGANWSLSPGGELISNEFSREILIEDVYRNENGDITTNPSSDDIVDPATKKVTITVSWQTPYPSSLENFIYLTRNENNSFTHTTLSKFNEGTITDTTLRATIGSSIPDDGEILLGAGGNSNWCTPQLTITAQDLPKSGVANGITAIEGKAFTGTGENASGVSFTDITIQNTKPPSTQLGKTFSGYKTNDIFGESDYAYIATDTNDREVVIIDLNSTNPYNSNQYLEAGYFNAPGNGDGNSIYTSGNIGYMTSGNKFYTFNLSGKIGSRPLLGSVSLAGTGVSTVVKGDYAFVAINSSGTQLQIINVSNPSSPFITGSTSLNASGASDVFVDDSGNTVYLTTHSSFSQNELFVLNTTSKTGSQPVLGSYDSSGMDPKGVIVVPGNIAIIVGTGGIEYQVINTASLTKCGELNIDSGVNGIAAVIESDGDAYSYIITGDTTTEFKIIEGGPGGTYSTSGSYESSAFDAASKANFNHFSANVSQPLSTTITLQVGVANPPSGTDCNDANYLFLGPDGTTNTVYTASGSTISGIIPYVTSGNYSNPGRCFKYKVNFASNNSLGSPVFEDILINYSP